MFSLLLACWSGECRSFGGGCEHELNQAFLGLILSSSGTILFPLWLPLGRGMQFAGNVSAQSSRKGCCLGVVMIMFLLSSTSQGSYVHSFTRPQCQAQWQEQRIHQAGSSLNGDPPLRP